jgi:hypothetical protein
VLRERAESAVADLPMGLVYAGFSFGAATAHRLTQTRPGARGALLYESCLPIAGEWAIGPLPQGVPVQIQGMDNDPFFAGEGDIDAARSLVATVGPELAELFVYQATRTCSQTAPCRRTPRRSCAGSSALPGLPEPDRVTRGFGTSREPGEG